MWLLLDIGNTRFKAVCYDGMAFYNQKIASYQAIGIAASLCPLKSLKPDAVYVANVAGDTIETAVRAWSVTSFGLVPHFVRSQSSFLGLHNAYAEPEKLGVDRWLAMLAAKQVYAGPVCVADCGSALTIDLVRENGEHLGGMILPGIEMQHHLFKTKLPQLEYQLPSLGSLPSWGRSTDECVGVGLASGLCGAIELAMRHAELNATGVRLIMTGGDAPQLAARLSIPYDYHEHLVLDGLGLLARHLEGSC
ncbi:MAG: type III pantothenate kinase [Chromatiales bacterium]|nr:type III pantothenate kinase [Gammaproteobacteria bacterium]MBW6475790.1 type III pantothenate kinase [Chromatiales bacterium]